MQGLTVAREENHWRMASLFAVMRHLGMEQSPFPSVDPIVSPLSQPCSIGYDGAGP